MSIKRNFFYNSLYQFILLFMPLITVPYISRVLGAEGLGIYVYSYTYSQYFILAGTLGLKMYASRQIAYVKSNLQKMNKTFWEIAFLNFTTLGLAWFLFVIVFVVIGKENKLIYLVQSIGIIASMFDILWFFQGIEDFKKITLRNMLVKFIAVISIFLIVKRKDDLILYCLILNLSQIFGQTIMWKYIISNMKFCLPNVKKIFKHIIPSLRLFVSQIAIQIYSLIDKTMLGIICGAVTVGIYDNSQKIISISITLVSCLGQVLLPRISTLFALSKFESIKENIYKAFSFILFLSFPITFGLIAISHSFVLWFYGSEFSSIEGLLYLGAWIMIPLSWSSVIGSSLLIPLKKEKEFTFSVVIGAIINISLNIIFLPKFNINAAIIISVISQFFVSIFQLIILKKFISIKKLFKGLHKYVIGSLIMYLFIKVIGLKLGQNILSTLIEIIIGIIVYFIIMIIFKDKHIKYFIRIIKK